MNIRIKPSNIYTIITISLLLIILYQFVKINNLETIINSSKLSWANALVELMITSNANYDRNIVNYNINDNKYTEFSKTNFSQSFDTEKIEATLNISRVYEKNIDDKSIKDIENDFHKYPVMDFIVNQEKWKLELKSEYIIDQKNNHTQLDLNYIGILKKIKKSAINS